MTREQPFKMQAVGLLRLSCIPRQEVPGRTARDCLFSRNDWTWSIRRARQSEMLYFSCCGFVRSKTRSQTGFSSFRSPQPVGHDAGSLRLGAIQDAGQYLAAALSLAIGQVWHLSTMRGGCDMQVLDIVDKLDLAAVLLLGAGHFLLRLLPLISDRVNARAVRLIEAKKKQDD